MGKTDDQAYTPNSKLKEKLCPKCKGTGVDKTKQETCKVCNGTGSVEIPESRITPALVLSTVVALFTGLILIWLVTGPHSTKATVTAYQTIVQTQAANATYTPLATFTPGPTATPVYITVPGPKGTPIVITATPLPPTVTPIPTSTPHPILSDTDPSGTNATAEPVGSWVPGAILSGSLPVAWRNDDYQVSKLVWHYPNISVATVTVFYCIVATVPDCGSTNPNSNSASFLCSADDLIWQACSIRPYQRHMEQGSPYWENATYDIFPPAGTNYIAVEVDDTTSGTYSPAIGIFSVQYQP